MPESANPSQARLDALKSSIVRCRWFLLITTLLSCLMLAHVYLEQLSYQTQQLQGIYGHRLRENKSLETITAEGAKLLQELEQAKRKNDVAEVAKLEKNLDQWSDKAFTFKRTDNTLSKVSLDDRELPILGLKIPTNDFLPVVSLMVVVFCAGVWLAVRSIRICLDAIRKSSDYALIETAKLYFTFTGGAIAGFQGKVAKTLQYAAFVMPVITLVLAIYLDVRPWWKERKGYLGTQEMFNARIAILIGCGVLIACFSGLAAYTSHKTDRENREPRVDPCLF